MIIRILLKKTIKLKIIIATFCSPILSYSQSSESIAKMFCKCDVINTSKLLPENKIVYIANEANSFSDINLTYNIIQKVNGQWLKKRKSKMTFNSINNGESESTNLVDFSYALQDEIAKETSILKINNTDFFFSIINLGVAGTASNGMNAFLFIFQDVNFKNRPIQLYYEKWDGEFSGNYKTDFGLVDDYKEFVSEANKFVTEKFGASNDDIDSYENFLMKWKESNNDIYDYLSDNNLTYFKPIVYDGYQFYDKIQFEYEVKEISTLNYKLITGFKSPAILYDKINDKSIIVYIPQGFPNGASWGWRSFYPINISDDILTIESDDEILEITLNKEIGNGKIIRYKKNND